MNSELLSKRVAIHLKICYHTRMKSKGESGVSRHSPDPPQPAWTRLERIQHLPVYRECLGKSASICWQITSHHFPFLVSLLEVARQGRSALMKRFSYRERDYAFGQAMLTLRTNIGLTQAGLADLLGVSRRAVGEWEAGSSYPKAHHLQHVMTLAVRASALPPGREAEEIRAFWKMAHQKVLLDESWLSALLNQPSPPPAPVPVEEAGSAAVESAPPPAAPSSLTQASQPADSSLPVGRRAPSARG